jgi:hypothetical protein
MSTAKLLTAKVLEGNPLTLMARVVGASGTNIVLPSNALSAITSWTVGITGNITGNLSGSVGSVTGNVGGNVTGSVGSVVGHTPQTGDSYAAITSTLPDSVPADGTRPSLQQAVYMVCQGMFEGSIGGTTWTIKKVDGSTTLFTVSLDSTTPTSKTRSS